jgi:hypothetical protein
MIIGGAVSSVVTGLKRESLYDVDDARVADGGRDSFDSSSSREVILVDEDYGVSDYAVDAIDDCVIRTMGAVCSSKVSCVASISSLTFNSFAMSLGKS